MSANSSTTYRNTAGAVETLAAQVGGDAKKRPVHHSEVVSILSAKTRPNNTTAYAAGALEGATADVIFTFDFGALGVPAGLIVGARLIRKDTAASPPRRRLFIHDAVPPTLTNADAAAHPLLWANRASRRGWIDFSSSIVSDAAGGDMSEFAGALSNLQGIPVAPADGIVRALLTTRDAFTPAALTDIGVILDLVA